MARKHGGTKRNCSLQAISPFPSVFKRLVLQTRKTWDCLGKSTNIQPFRHLSQQQFLAASEQCRSRSDYAKCGNQNFLLFDTCFFLTPSQTNLVFTCLQNKSIENTVGKGEIARNEQFLLFPQRFLPIWKPF